MNRMHWGVAAIAGGAVVSTLGFAVTAIATPGTLMLTANGEDFVREGLTSKDGWAVTFDRLYVTLAAVTAYQTEPPFDTDAGEAIDPISSVTHAGPTTVDLTAGAENAVPIATLPAPAGRYNALSWEMVAAPSGSAAGHVMLMEGMARKNGQALAFSIALDTALAYTCGDYVGDERKGFLQAGATADLEATLHFDHVFGDGELSADDPLNQDALGFGPLAALAEDNRLDIDEAGLRSQLSAADYGALARAVAGLGHVGEGHCLLTA